jgi:N-acetylglucosamine kinase-like BadF-type ATPase
MGLILGVDGGNSKTALLVATTDGELVSTVLGPGTNSHAVGAEGVADVLGALIAESGAPLPVDHAVFFLCGADVPSDIDSLERAIDGRGWARERTVDNDTFALLRAGTDAANAVAVICGSGINVVGRASDDGRGGPTELVRIVREHFGSPTVEAVGADVHYKWIPQARLGELAPKVVEAAQNGDPVARLLIVRLAEEIDLMVRRSMRDLELSEADVVLGGGMLQSGDGLLYELVLERLPDGARAVAVADPLVLGAGLAALDAAGATVDAKLRLRGELRAR